MSLVVLPPSEGDLMADRLGLNLARHQNVSTSYSFLAATDYSTAASKITGKTGWTIYVCRIQLSKTTDASKIHTFQDSAGTPVLFAKGSPGLQPDLWEFGPEGYALTEGKDFQHKMDAAGDAGSVTVTAYMKPTASTGLVANVAGTRGGL